MTDLDELSRLIRADAEARGQTISRLGYFCAPFRPDTGPFSDKVIKVYRGLRDQTALDRLHRCHDDYVAALLAGGVPMPETEFHLLNLDGARVPVIVQQALPINSLMRPRMQKEDLDSTLKMMEAAGQVIAHFWLWAREQEGRIGFHPSIRNFAVIDDQAVFFDTFPPLIDYTRDEMGRMLLTFSDSRLMRMVGPLMQKRVTGIQDEWYSPPETLVGLVGSACRLRPDDAGAYLDWGREFVVREMAPWAQEALAGMKEPPKLPGYWTGFRKLLGLQGEPNV
ncbi:DUF6206 family protein [Mameliella sediminis]|uniref:DUF6206 family protein n=1 Tax=Mameliella sediminis TaxID=2836866 RepID=UPI001C44A10E|nr:DUF6206 family protein [Mameliella sediminis]MBV7396076.1 hypothetical protein [Mameliella sediminis]MBY6160487.1 hypothetical protein [Mameliella alba]MBY6168957.1 hypothetical protein [Mameliella alba]MBY6173822.1 hypothetical protein [Mameliella alba]